MKKLPEFEDLENVNLRKVWAHEANDFTPWLARNLPKLSEALGIPLVEDETEAPVRFGKVDILATNEYDNSTVIIENQLEESNDTHMGQIMSYFVNSEKPNTVIWIAEGFHDKHLEIIQYMNENKNWTKSDWFAVQVKVQKLAKRDEPALILQFDVKGFPSGWNSNKWKVRYKAGSKGKLAVGERGELLIKFWELYKGKYSEDNIPKPKHRLRDKWAGANTWDDIEVAGLTLSRYIAVARKHIGIFLRKPKSDNKLSDLKILERVQRYDDKFQDELGTKPSEAVSVIADREYYIVDTLDIDFYDEDKWDEIIEWFHERYHTCRRILEEPPES